MSIVKKIAFTGIMAALGIVAFRFVRIVYRAVTEKPAQVRGRGRSHAKRAG